MKIKEKYNLATLGYAIAHNKNGIQIFVKNLVSGESIHSTPICPKETDAWFDVIRWYESESAELTDVIDHYSNLTTLSKLGFIKLPDISSNTNKLLYFYRDELCVCFNLTKKIADIYYKDEVRDLNISKEMAEAVLNQMIEFGW